MAAVEEVEAASVMGRSERRAGCVSAAMVGEVEGDAAWAVVPPRPSLGDPWVVCSSFDNLTLFGLLRVSWIIGCWLGYLMWFGLLVSSLMFVDRFDDCECFRYSMGGRMFSEHVNQQHSFRLFGNPLNTRRYSDYHMATLLLYGLLVILRMLDN